LWNWWFEKSFPVGEGIGWWPFTGFVFARRPEMRKDKVSSVTTAQTLETLFDKSQ